ncbi:MAG: polysaccharide deacetylase family protein [Thermodesulfobacteriota bacterium]
MRVFALVLALMAGMLATWPAALLAGELWSAGELAAKPGEDKPGRLGPVDPSGPAKPVPERNLPQLPPELRGSIRRVETGGGKLVALTFDLCELSDQRAGYDGTLVDVLRAQGVAATFFAGGRWMRSHPERTMQLMSDPLFEVGSHAWTHGNFGVLDPARMREQVEWTQAQYEIAWEELAALARERGAQSLMERVPPSIRVFRFPYGRCRAEALDLLASMGLAAAQWDVNMMDAAKGRTAQAIARDVLRGVRPGSIVLGHANGFGHATAEALGIIIPELKARGYRFVTVSRLLASGRAEASPECYDSRKGDTAVYDAIYGDGTRHRRR